MIGTTSALPELIQVEGLDPLEYRTVAAWITDSKDLPNISGIKSHYLSPEELQNWFETATIGLIVRFDGAIVGLATLSKHEVPLKHDEIELCHCIVHPEYRRIYNGASMVLQLMAYAKTNNYKTVVGRVVKNNASAEKMLKFLKWEVMTKDLPNNDNDVTWFKKRLL